MIWEETIRPNVKYRKSIVIVLIKYKVRVLHKNYNTRMVDGMNQGIECLKETVLKCTGPKQPPPRFRQAQN